MLAAVALPLRANASGVDMARGNYTGSGRACYGMLTITARFITWMTPFSQCRRSAYTIREEQDGPAGLRIAYQLDRPSAPCRYRVLVLTHDVSTDLQIGWNVAAYRSWEDAVQNRRDDALGCYLYRD